jgi:hypothetical protein
MGMQVDEAGKDQQAMRIQSVYVYRINSRTRRDPRNHSAFDQQLVVDQQPGHRTWNGDRAICDQKWPFHHQPSCIV